MDAMSLNVMKALKGPEPGQQAPGGGGESKSGTPSMPANMPGSQIFNAVMKAIEGLMSAAKGKDGKEGLSENDQQNARGAVAGVQNGRMSAQRDSMNG